MTFLDLRTYSTVRDNEQRGGTGDRDSRSQNGDKVRFQSNMDHLLVTVGCT